VGFINKDNIIQSRKYKDKYSPSFEEEMQGSKRERWGSSPVWRRGFPYFSSNLANP